MLALLAGTYRSAEGVEAHVVPGEGAALDVWVLGSSGGESAEVAGQRGLPFAANYHVSPASVLDAVDGYRAAFRPSADARPPVRRRLRRRRRRRVRRRTPASWPPATGCGSAASAPAPGRSRSRRPRRPAGTRWTDDGPRARPGPRRHPVRRRRRRRSPTSSRCSPRETGADELLLTTITHDHADRVRSYELLAAEWARHAVPAAAASVDDDASVSRRSSASRMGRCPSPPSAPTDRNAGDRPGHRHPAAVRRAGLAAEPDRGRPRRRPEHGDHAPHPVEPRPPAAAELRRGDRALPDRPGLGVPLRRRRPPLRHHRVAP